MVGGESIGGNPVLRVEVGWHPDHRLTLSFPFPFPFSLSFTVSFPSFSAHMRSKQNQRVGEEEQLPDDVGK